MPSSLNRPSAPFYVQFEVTQACNHRCFFCYNEGAAFPGPELSTSEIKNILQQLRHAGVFSINFNGGEPLTRPDFFDLAAYARELGFDLHVNTNGTLIDDKAAKAIAASFPSACVSVLASDPDTHDRYVGRVGAYERVQTGIDHLLANGVKVEINVCTFKANHQDLYAIARNFARAGVHVLCVTRYILAQPQDKEHILGVDETVKVLGSLERIAHDFPSYIEVKLPGPVPYCELQSTFKPQLERWNTPCQVGYGLCRISPQGIVTPCPLSSLVMGDLRTQSFDDIWASSAWDQFVKIEHLPRACRDCTDLAGCRGGCVGYDDCLIAGNCRPTTLKWSLSDA